MPVEIQTSRVFTRLGRTIMHIEVLEEEVARLEAENAALRAAAEQASNPPSRGRSNPKK